jgi:hypothetical protein
MTCPSTAVADESVYCVLANPKNNGVPISMNLIQTWVFDAICDSSITNYVRCHSEILTLSPTTRGLQIQLLSSGAGSTIAFVPTIENIGIVVVQNSISIVEQDCTNPASMESQRNGTMQDTTMWYGQRVPSIYDAVFVEHHVTTDDVTHAIDIIINGDGVLTTEHDLIIGEAVSSGDCNAVDDATHFECAQQYVATGDVVSCWVRPQLGNFPVKASTEFVGAEFQAAVGANNR